jgi:hypothetical protein
LPGIASTPLYANACKEILYSLDLDDHYASLGWLDAVASVGEAHSEPASAFVIFKKLSSMAFEGIEEDSRYDTSLAYAATGGFAGPSRLPDGRFVSC